MFIELQRGHSFKGVAQYCLHDADRAPTSDRVDFVEVRNLATDDPHVAWRIMAAKHYAQDELKRRAGVGLGGPTDGKPVGHLYISWGRDEAEAQGLDRSEMLHSADRALGAIGASDYPALVIAHNDTEHPHCHIVCCLIGDDGRLKKNWKEKEKLSRFALEREIEVHGEPVVKLRERNWKHREAGEKTPTKKKQPRHLYELEKAAEQDEKIRLFAEKHKAKLIDLNRRVDGHTDANGNRVEEGKKERHARHQERLRWCYEERDRRARAETEKAQATQVRAIRQEYDQPWQELFNQQEAERETFRQNETNLLGRAYNTLRYTDWKSVFSKQQEAGELGASVFSRAFNTLSDSGHREQMLAKRQQDEQERLRAEQRREERLVQDRLKAEQTQRLEANRRGYARKAESMQQRQEATSEAIKQQQRELTRERNAELRAYRARVKALKHERVEQHAASEPPSPRPTDLTPAANRAFGVPEKQADEQGEDAAHVRPKRTRKRKHPSERTNRRHTKPDGWDARLASRFDERPGRDAENDHER